MTNLIRDDDFSIDLEIVSDNEIEFVDFVEEEYDLSSIGLDETYLCLEQFENYIYNDKDFVFHFENAKQFKELIKIDNNQYILTDESDIKLYLTEEQYLMIFDILQSKA